MTSLRALILLFAITSPLFACIETTYEPCAGKQPGDRCQLCAPDDSSCVETMIVKTCSVDGQCGARRNDAGNDAGVAADSSTESGIRIE